MSSLRIPKEHNPNYRVLHVIDHLGCGGAQDIVSNILQYGSIQTFSYYCCALHGPGVIGEELRNLGFLISYFAKNKKNIAKIINKYCKNVLEIKPHVINFHLEASILLGLAFTVRRCKIVVTIHALKSQLPRWFNTLFACLIKRADGIVVEDQVSFREISDLGFPVNRIRYIPLGTDFPERLVSFKRTKGNVRRELGLPMEAPLILNVARLHPRKGQALLLQAFRQVLEHYPQTRCIIVGDGPEREPLRRLAHQLGLDHAVILIGERRDLERFYLDADLFVMSAVDEAMGVVVCQAMAAGLPVIAFEAGSVREIVTNGVTGILVPVGDVKALAEKIIEVLTYLDKYRLTMGQAASQLIARKYSAKVMVRRYEKFYQNLLEI